MYALHEDPTVPVVRAIAGSLLFVLALGGAEPGAKESPGEKPPPELIQLPEAGTYEATEILPFAAELSGRSVLLEGEDLGEIQVKIPPTLGCAKVNLEALKLILRASGIHLCEWEDPEEGPVLVASRRANWKPEPKSITRVIEIFGGDFAAISAQVQKAVEERNAELPEGAEPMVCLPVSSKRKIILSSPRKEDVEAVLAKVEELRKALEEEAKRRPHMYLYVGKHRRVADLEKALSEELSPAERNVLRTVVASQGNRLLIRCPAEVWKKVSEILERIDVPEKRSEGGAGEKAGRPKER